MKITVAFTSNKFKSFTVTFQKMIRNMFSKKKKTNAKSKNDQTNLLKLISIKKLTDNEQLIICATYHIYTISTKNILSIEDNRGEIC